MAEQQPAWNVNKGHKSLGLNASKVCKSACYCKSYVAYKYPKTFITES